MKTLRFLSLMASAAVLAATGCGGDSGGGNDMQAGGATSETAGAIQVFPPKIYSGFDGTNSYQAPIIAHNAASKVTWTISDESIASLMPSGAKGENLMLTMKKAGSATITATAGGKTSTGTLSVTAYTSAQREAGAHRYTTAPDADNPPCMTCHGADRGANRPNHSPTELDADTDTEVQNTFTSGTDPEGRRIIDISEFKDLLTTKGYTHMWKVTPEEKTGLLAYLRSLEPLGFPEYDPPTTMK